MVRPRTLWAAALLLPIACTDGDGSGRGARAPEARPLVSASAWRPVAAADDPFPDRPAEAACAADSTAVEQLAGEESWEVATAGCPYVTAVQPSLHAVAQGESLYLRIWHGQLTAGVAAEAHLAVAFGGVLEWEERIAIPGPGGLVAHRWEAARALAAGEDIHFHLHNHGANRWSFIELSVTPPNWTPPSLPPDPNACAAPGAVGNALGVGEHCTRDGGQCGDNSKAVICTVDFRPLAPPFCTIFCRQDDECGADSVCTGDGTGGQAGCVPMCMAGDEGEGEGGDEADR